MDTTLQRAPALVIGDVSLVRALGRSNIPVVLATSEPAAPAARSRYCAGVVRTASFVDDPAQAVDDVVAWSRAQPRKPVLFYQGDHDLLALSRHREALAPHALFVLPDATLVEDLVDKLRFAALATRLGLPVPPTLTLQRAPTSVCEWDVTDDNALARWSHFPCVLKPAVRSHWIGSPLQQQHVDEVGKAIRVESRDELERVVPMLRAHATDCVLQAAVEGGEERILSYHAYVRAGGEVVVDFTGRKVRTRPRRYGYSTCVMIAHDEEVLHAGRAACRALDFHGVVKMDFKRDARDERLYLLEVNPRFNLWHHPATVAGYALPALVYADCVQPGSARAPAPSSVRDDVRWMNAGDVNALLEYRRAGELSVTRWLRELVTTDVHEALSLQDPLPFLHELAARARRALPRLARLG